MRPGVRTGVHLSTGNILICVCVRVPHWNTQMIDCTTMLKHFNWSTITNYPKYPAQLVFMYLFFSVLHPVSVKVFTVPFFYFLGMVIIQKDVRPSAFDRIGFAVLRQSLARRLTLAQGCKIVAWSDFFLCLLQFFYFYFYLWWDSRSGICSKTSGCSKASGGRFWCSKTAEPLVALLPSQLPKMIFF